MWYDGVLRVTGRVIYIDKREGIGILRADYSMDAYTFTGDMKGLNELDRVEFRASPRCRCAFEVSLEQKEKINIYRKPSQFK